MSPLLRDVVLLFVALAAPLVVGLTASITRRFSGGVQAGPAPASKQPPPAAAVVPDAGAGPDMGLTHRADPPATDRVGVILVHGIGEQRRFQHLDTQLRDLVRSLQGLQLGEVKQVSVDISGSGAAAFHAEQDTWSAGPGPSVTVVVDHTLNGALQRTRLLVHEVWWADVNEPYSIAKQFRFWLWGLAVWALPTRPTSAWLGTGGRVAPPAVPLRAFVWDRLRLWMVGGFFMLLGYSVGALTFLATRLFNWQTPNLLRTIANYISAVKLYNQQRRFGPGLWWSREEFLDSVGEPPRVSIRRRMIRAVADVACNRYHRWYVLAHSQGSVVAFNGLMETAYAWPGYLDEQRWERLKGRAMAGPATPGMRVPDPPLCRAARAGRSPGRSPTDHGSSAASAASSPMALL